jgi:hypothetical protein
VLTGSITFTSIRVDPGRADRFDFCDGGWRKPLKDDWICDDTSCCVPFVSVFGYFQPATEFGQFALNFSVHCGGSRGRAALRRAQLSSSEFRELPSYKVTAPLLRQCYRFYVFWSIRDFIWRPDPAGSCFLFLFVMYLVLCCACDVFASLTTFSEVRVQKPFTWGDSRVENLGPSVRRSRFCGLLC